MNFFVQRSGLRDLYDKVATLAARGLSEEEAFCIAYLKQTRD
jgi:hypothetical protein